MTHHLFQPSSLLAMATGLVVACSSSPAKKDPTQQPPSKPTTGSAATTNAVTVAVAAVTLGADCQGLDPQVAVATPKAATTASGPKLPTPAGKRAPQPADDSRTAGEMAEPSSMNRAVAQERICEQTSVQLLITSANDPTTIVLRTVELLDDKGQVLGTLTPRLPTHWDDKTGQYTAWDLSVAAGGSEKVSWALTSPVWSNFGMTPNEAANHTFRVRVTINAAGNDQVVDGQARVVVTSPPTPLPPGVVT